MPFFVCDIILTCCRPRWKAFKRCSRFASLFFCEMAVGVCASVERDQSAPSQTAPQQAEFGSQTERLFFSLGNQEQKARASRSRASLLYTVAMVRDSVVCQYSSTIARQEQDAPSPTAINRLWFAWGPYGGKVYRKSRLSADICIYIAECLPQPTAHGSGSERRWKPEACPFLRTERHTSYTKHAIITSCNVQAVAGQ